jgi:hypothetical protein
VLSADGNGSPKAADNGAIYRECCGHVQVLFVYGLHPIARWQYRQIPGLPCSVRVDLPAAPQLLTRSIMYTAGPPPAWLFGNLLTLLRVDWPDAVQSWAAVYGPVFKVLLQASQQRPTSVRQ